MKVAEPQNGENIEQRAGGVSPGTRELCTRAEKVPRTKRVSFEVELGKNFVGWKILGILRGSLGRPGRAARRATTTGTAPYFPSLALFGIQSVFGPIVLLPNLHDLGSIGECEGWWWL